MALLTSVVDGYGCSASATDSGWLAAVKVIPDVDGKFLKFFERLQSAEYFDGVAEPDWSRSFCSAQQRIVLLQYHDGQPDEVELTAAARIEGPSTCDGPVPAVAWAERQNGAWHLMLWRDGHTEQVASIPRLNAPPAVASTGDRVLIAVAGDRDGGSSVQVYDASGDIIFETPGRYPGIAGAPGGAAVLVVERAAARRVDLVSYLLRAGQEPAELPVPTAGDLDLSPSIFWHGGTSRFWLAWESCPSWGLDERVGLHRDLSVCTLDVTDGVWTPAPGTSGGYVHFQAEAFRDQSSQNLTPIRPLLFKDGDGVGLACRRFRYTGKYPHGWDTYVMRTTPRGWAEPVRVSPDTGQGDSAYAMVPQADGGLVAFCPSCHIHTFLSFDEEAAGQKWERRDRRASRQRIDVIALAPDEVMPTPTFPEWKRSAYVIPPSTPEPAPQPPALDQRPEDHTLIWADLHAHCAYSKCMGCNDGMPLDVLRYQRDVLGCQALCLTDHVEYMNGGEFAHVMDRIEREAGDTCIPLYGVEWARYPAHHTNFFAIDRTVFDRLRTLMFEHAHLTPLYRAIKDELPAGSVVAIRHMHGVDQDEFGVSGARVTDTHDPDVEWAMEAMQTRGNMMLDGMRGHYPRIPVNFLNAGCHVGVVGGSDHSRGGGVNAFCLTGLWVTEPTGEGVFEALRNRHTLGAANGKVAVHATLGGVSMGQRVESDAPVRVEVHAACARPVRRICLMRDGELLPWQDVGACSASVELIDQEASPGEHWYSVTVEGTDPYPKAPLLAHTSPFFVTLR